MAMIDRLGAGQSVVFGSSGASETNGPPTLLDVAVMFGSALSGGRRVLDELQGYASNLTGIPAPKISTGPNAAPQPGTLPELHAMAQEFQNVIGQIGMLTAHLHRMHG